MTFLGWRLVRESEYAALKRSSVVRLKLTEVYRWFSGWKDLDLIWDYVLKRDYYGSISSCREQYARARGTNVYGQREGA